MAKERLSRLQKWILTQTFNSVSFSKRDMKKFFGKTLRQPLTNSQRLILYKSLASLLRKELITKGPFKNFILTEKGFLKLMFLTKNGQGVILSEDE